jgi:hypothetical protein
LSHKILVSTKKGGGGEREGGKKGEGEGRGGREGEEEEK